MVRLTHGRAAGQQTFSPHVLLTELVKQHPKGIKKKTTASLHFFFHKRAKCLFYSANRIVDAPMCACTTSMKAWKKQIMCGLPCTCAPNEEVEEDDDDDNICPRRSPPNVEDSPPNVEGAGSA